MANQGEFQIVEFSPELKAAILQYRDTKSRMYDYLLEAYNDHPDTKSCDQRDFSDMMEVDQGLSDDKLKEKCGQYIRDYTGPDPEKRKQILDHFYDRFQSVNLDRLNLDCLKGQDQGERGEDRLTDSERDVMKLLSTFRCMQAIGTKTKENPEYIKERFGNPQKAEQMNIQSDAIHLISFYMTELFAKNHLDLQLLDTPYDSLGYADQASVMDIVVQRSNQAAAGMEGRQAQTDIRFSLSQEKNGLYGLDQGQLPGMSAVQTAEMARNAYDTTFGAVYMGFSTLERLQELGVDQFDLIHIDGMSAREQFGRKYQNSGLSETQKAVQMKKDVMGAVLEGGHHVDLITLDLDERGNIVPNAHAVKADLHGFDQMEKQNEHGRLRRAFDWGPFKIHTRGDRADRVNSDNRSASERLSEVIPDIDQKARMLRSAKRMHEGDLKDFGLQEEPDSPRVAREKEKLGQIQAQIDAVRDRNRPLERQAAELKNELDAVGRLEKARQRVGRIGEKAGATGTVKTDGCLTDLEAGTAMETVLGDYTKEEQGRVKDAYLKDFLPNFGRMNGVWQTNGMGKEQLEQRRLELTSGGQTAETPFHLEVIDGLLTAGTPEAQQAYRDSVLKDYLEGADRYGKLCGDMLEHHPAAGLTDQMKDEKRTQIENLEGQITPVPEGLLRERAEQEARVNDVQELEGNPAERTSAPPPDYQAPKTREEALGRIAALDARHGPAMEYGDKCARIAQAGVIATIDTMNPYNGRYQAQVVTDYFDKLGIDTGSLGAEQRQSLEESRSAMRDIAGSRPGAPIPHGIEAHGNNMVRLYMDALNSDPALARFGAMGQEFREDCTRKSAEREQLLQDMRDFGKAERLAALAAGEEKLENAEKAGPEKEDAAKDGPTKEDAQKGGPEKEDAAKDGPAKEDAAKDGPAKEDAAKDGPAKEDAAKDGPAKEDAAKDGPAKEDAAKDGPAKEDAAKDGPAKEDAAKDDPAKEDAAKDGPAKEDAQKGGPAKEDAVKDGPAKEDAAKDGPAKEDAAKAGPAKDGAQKAGPLKEEPAKQDAAKTEADTKKDGGRKEITLDDLENRGEDRPAWRSYQSNPLFTKQKMTGKNGIGGHRNDKSEAKGPSK